MKTSSVRSELDSMIVEIELTLVSIIQGVALYFLIESARGALSLGKIMFWPYVVAGLLMIFIFWSRSVLHIITVIRWPLEFGHNFLYITCAFFEAALFSQLNDPRRWFIFGAAFAAIGWALFVYDLRLIRARAQDSAGEASTRLSILVTRDQLRNITVLLPAIFLLNVGSVLVIQTHPEFFLVRNGHLWLIAAQLIGFGGYLFYVVRFYDSLSKFISQARAEWRATNDASADIN